MQDELLYTIKKLINKVKLKYHIHFLVVTYYNLFIIQNISTAGHLPVTCIFVEACSVKKCNISY